MRFSETPVAHDVPPPTLGQHTDEILRDLLKRNPSEIAKLRSEGIV
jgi:formyl-CoA transferase